MEKLLLGIGAGKRRDSNVQPWWRTRDSISRIGCQVTRCEMRQRKQPSGFAYSEQGEAIFGQRIRTVCLMPCQPQTLFRTSAQVMSMVTGRRTGVACYIYHPRQ